MRQRQEGLGFWLNREPPPVRFRARVGNRLGFWLRVPPIAAAVTEFDSSLGADVLSETGLWDSPAVKNGLDFLEPIESVEATHLPVATGPGEQLESGATFSLPGVLNIDFSIFFCPVRGRDLLSHPEIRDGSIRITSRNLRVHSPALLVPNRIGRASGVLLPSDGKVLAGDLRPTPHTRRSLELGSLPGIRMEQLAGQAEATKGWEHGQAEVVALFPRVPVELLSRARFVQQEALLIYTLHATGRVTRTRIHDLIAVRDRRSGEIHLMPERTKFKIAGLSLRSRDDIQ